MRFINNFSVVLLDLNGTFMFGHDRFGPTEDYFVTYHAAGGRNLDRDSVLKIVNASHAGLSQAYSAPERVDDFPTVGEALREYGAADEQEIPILERVFAAHEIGRIPPDHEKFLRDTAKSHKLGIVSNIWSGPDTWLTYLRDSDLYTIFKTIVFSSEGRSIKPSRRLFEQALAAFQADSAVLFVGDNLKRDIIPAKALGMSTAWIAPPGSADSAADVVIDSLPKLADVAS